MKLSLVVPCYNEQQNVREFFGVTKKTFSKQNFDYEIIFVNDGSRDNTMNELKKIYKENEDSKIKIINFSRNFGKESGIFAGISKAEGEMICLIDADLQQDPEVVLKMVEFLDNNNDYDCVTAYQEKRKENIFISFLKNCFYKIINKMCDIDFMSAASDFRTFRRNVADAILDMPEYFRFSKGIFSWVGFNTHYMPYKVKDRFGGESKWSLISLFKYAFEGIIAFTTFPLKIGTYLGVGTSLAAIIYFFVIVIQKMFFGIEIPGYPTIVALILLIGGVQLFVLGIIGEYLARSYIQGKNRPIYIEKDYYTYKK